MAMMHARTNTMQHDVAITLCTAVANHEPLFIGGNVAERLLCHALPSLIFAKRAIQSVSQKESLTGQHARTHTRVCGRMVQALTLFSTYFTTKNTVLQRDIVTYSEIFGSSWDGVSEGTPIPCHGSSSDGALLLLQQLGLLLILLFCCFSSG